MKTIFAIASAVVGLTMIYSCSDTTGGQSTPVDSSNISGQSPVQYSEGMPSNTIDSTVQARDQYSRDTLGQRAGQTQPSGNGTNTSNTMDARTNSGSANQGDADQDHKR
jgi:hypothetical protein